MITLHEDMQHLSLGDFDMCLFTYLYSPLLDYFRPKTNVKSQRYRVFVFMTVQVRILQKHHEKQPKSLKQARDVEKSLKLKLKM